MYFSKLLNVFINGPVSCGSVGCCHPIQQKAAGSIFSQDTYLGCGFDPWSGYMREETNQCFSLTSRFVSVSHSLHLLSLKSINIFKKILIFINDSIYKILLILLVVRSLFKEKYNANFSTKSDIFHLFRWFLNYWSVHTMICKDDVGWEEQWDGVGRALQKGMAKKLM